MKKNSILVGVSVAAFLGPFTQTVYTPNLPELRQVFQVDTVQINLTISLFTAILAASNFIIGPLADRRGRRITSLVGLAVYVAGSLVCLMAPGYGSFLTGRALQAAGISTGALIAAAVIGDLFEGLERARAMSVYQTLVFLGPVLGPVVGGLIASHLSWRWAFGLLAASGLATLLYNLVQLKETKPAGATPPRFSFGTLRAIVADREALSLLLIGFSQFFGYYIFLVFLPALLAQRFAIPVASRGFYFIPLTAGILGGIHLGGRLQVRMSAARIVGVCSYGSGVATLLFFACLRLSWLNLPALLAFLLCYGVLLGASLPVQTALLVGLFKQERATAVGLYNFCRFAGAAAGPLAGGWIEMRGGTATVFLALGVLLTAAAAGGAKMGIAPSRGAHAKSEP